MVALSRDRLDHYFVFLRLAPARSTMPRALASALIGVILDSEQTESFS